MNGSKSYHGFYFYSILLVFFAVKLKQHHKWYLLHLLYMHVCIFCPQRTLVSIVLFINFFWDIGPVSLSEMKVWKVLWIRMPVAGPTFCTLCPVLAFFLGKYYCTFRVHFVNVIIEQTRNVSPLSVCERVSYRCHATHLLHCSRSLRIMCEDVYDHSFYFQWDKLRENALLEI